VIVLSGGELVLPDRIPSAGTLIMDEGRIVDIRADSAAGAASSPFAFHGHYIVPGFIDVHVHGVDGFDTLGGSGVVGEMARRLPRHGVTAFCPTTVACAPAALAGLLDQVREARERQPDRSARVLPAHIESNFLNPEFAGAQPLHCLRSARQALDRQGAWLGTQGARTRDQRLEFEGAEILLEFERHVPDVGIVTLAPEIDGGIDLVEWLVAHGIRVSLGHSGATYDVALAAIAAGARRATHLFNRMPPIGHRHPGLAGAVLQSDDVAAELICDGVHVHPAMVRMAVATKHPSRVMAVSDGTAAAGLSIGAHARLGEEVVLVRESAAYTGEGILAGSVQLLDRAFAMLVRQAGLSLVDAATMCATTPARELGLVGHGALVRGNVADLVVLDGDFRVVQTYVGGQLVYARGQA
jgi:N-acetylglucosamine-6-phosphate deacetylase